MSLTMDCSARSGRPSWRWGFRDSSLFYFLSVQVRHVKQSSSDNSFGYHEKSLGIVTMGGEPTIELTNPTRAEISCPMHFRFYPFDTQTCNFIIEPLMFDVRFIPWFLESKQLDDQNIQMSYDITIQPLLAKFLARDPDEVRNYIMYNVLPCFNAFPSLGHFGAHEDALSESDWL